PRGVGRFLGGQLPRQLVGRRVRFRRRFCLRRLPREYVRFRHGRLSNRRRRLQVICWLALLEDGKPVIGRRWSLPLGKLVLLLRFLDREAHRIRLRLRLLGGGQRFKQAVEVGNLVIFRREGV